MEPRAGRITHMDDGKSDLTRMRAGGLRWTVRRDRIDLPAALLDTAGGLLGDRSARDRMPPAEDGILKFRDPETRIRDPSLFATDVVAPPWREEGILCNDRDSQYFITSIDND